MAAKNINKMGTLFKLSANKKWDQRYVVLTETSLRVFKYQASFHKFMSKEAETTRNRDYDLLSCTIKPAAKPPHTFQLVHPKKGVLSLKAITEEDCQAWLKSISDLIQMLILPEPSYRTSLMPNGSTIALLMKEPSNQICADCSSPYPHYISTNTGAIICKTCAEIHKAMPPGVSKIKSLTIDALPPITVNFLSCIPNYVVNDIYEARIHQNTVKPTANSSIEEKTLWIRDKYNGKIFVEPFGGIKTELHQQLVDAIQQEDIPTFMRLIAQGAAPQPITCDGMYILHLAIQEGIALMVEALLQVGVDVDLADKRDGRTSIFFAIENGPLELVKLLVNEHNANLDVHSNDGYDPLSYAQAILNEEPDNQLHKEIYEFLLKKRPPEFPTSSVSSLIGTLSNPPSLKIPSQLTLDMKTISGYDKPDSEQSSSSESINLGDYL